ncbi:MAG: EamA family transporter [Pseudomonadales bacterium]|nr:EamA family transporter [Pseudomonadales bacterium]
MKANPCPLSVNTGLTYVLFAAIAWGTGGAVAAVLYQSSEIGPIAVSFWRFAIGALLLAALALIISAKGGKSSIRDLIRNQWGHLAVIGMGLAVYQTAYFAAVQQSGLAVATIVTLGLGPILIAVGSHLTMAERISRAGVLTITFAIVGLGLLTSGDDFGPRPLQGLALALLSAVGYAGVTLMTRAMGRRNSTNQFNVTLLGIIIGTVCLLPFAILEGLIPSAGNFLHNAALLGYLGLVPTALAYGLFNIGLSYIRATTASVIVLIEPVTAAAIAVLFLGEQLTTLGVLGTAVLLLSVIVLALAERNTSVVTTNTDV